MFMSLQGFQMLQGPFRRRFRGSGDTANVFFLFSCLLGKREPFSKLLFHHTENLSELGTCHAIIVIAVQEGGKLGASQQGS